MILIKPTEITHRHLILCEGRDEQLFFIHYLNSDEIKGTHNKLSEDVEVIDFGGNENLSSFLPAFKQTPGFELVKSILVIRDAEKSVESAINRIKRAFNKVGWISPELPGEWADNGQFSLAFLLLPSLKKETEAGTLEDLCINIIKPVYHPNEVTNEFSKCMNQLKKEIGSTFSHPFKSKMHGFFSLTDRFVGMKIGEAAKAGAFDWDASDFDTLRKLLVEAFSKSGDDV